MRRTVAFHDYEAVYYVGMPLLMFTLIMVCVRKRYGARAARDLSVAAVAVFVLSAYYMGQSDYTIGIERENELRAARISDFEAIREIAGDKKVFVTREVRWNNWDSVMGERFYMHGRFFEKGHPDDADFIVSAVRQDVDALLTPDNQTAFLYSKGFGPDTADWLAGQSEPIYRGGEFDVYVDGGRIYYIGLPYTYYPGGDAPKFFLHVMPVDENDLTETYREAGFENLDFNLRDNALDPGHDWRQIAMAELPRYPIAEIKTGQFTEGGKIWEARARLEGGEWIAEPPQSDSRGE